MQRRLTGRFLKKRLHVQEVEVGGAAGADHGGGGEHSADVGGAPALPRGHQGSGPHRCRPAPFHGIAFCSYPGHAQHGLLS